MNLQELFNYLRNEKSMSDESIGKEIKMHKTTVYRYRTGENKRFKSRDDMATIAKAFNMKLTYDKNGIPDFQPKSQFHIIENIEVNEPHTNYELRQQLEQYKQELALAKKMIREKDQEIARKNQTIKKIDSAIHEITNGSADSLELDPVR